MYSDSYVEANIAEIKKPGSKMWDHAPSNDDGRKKQLMAVMSHDAVDHLTEIKIPCFIFSGDDDPLIPVHNSIFMAKMIPNSTLTIIPKGRHAAWTEFEDEYHAGLLDFLSHARRGIIKNFFLTIQLYL